MKYFYSLFFISIIFYSSSCKKETSIPIDFSKITVADSSCIYISEVDTTDWTYDAVWSAQEASFMNFTDTIQLTDTSTGYVQLSAPCPNPNEGAFILGLNTEKQCKMKLVCVNTDMQVLYYTTRMFTGGPIATGYDFRALTSFHRNSNYRFYYAFYNANGSMFYKGHGDFRIE